MSTTYKEIGEANEESAFLTNKEGYDIAVLDRVTEQDHSLSDEQWQATINLVHAAPKMLQALEEACKELVANDIITKILREEKGLPHTPCKTLTLVEETLKEVYGIG